MQSNMFEIFLNRQKGVIFPGGTSLSGYSESIERHSAHVLEIRAQFQREVWENFNDFHVSEVVTSYELFIPRN